MMQMLVRDFLFVDGRLVFVVLNWLDFLVLFDRMVDFLLDEFLLFDDGGFVVNVHRLQQSVSVLALFHFNWNMDYDFAPSHAVGLNVKLMTGVSSEISQLTLRIRQ